MKPPPRSRRRSDVIEHWTRVLLGVVLLLGVPLMGLVGGGSAYDSARARADRERASRQLVQATLAEDAASTGGSWVASGTSSKYRATVRWTDSAGQRRTGAASVPAGTKRGSRTDVWLDERGRITAAPRSDADVRAEAVTMAVAAGAGSVAVAVGVWLLLRRGIHRCRMAEWERAWAEVEPEWSRRA
ncbi:hypothetical protein U9R90_20055 [Streptomyces sp. E11-3]|uniref:Rv1733c family protein n=1 Tax=Streptomyces sp. E11-3 TaxID=3110112 RepID=UPI00397EF270